MQQWHSITSTMLHSMVGVLCACVCACVSVRLVSVLYVVCVCVCVWCVYICACDCMLWACKTQLAHACSLDHTGHTVYMHSNVCLSGYVCTVVVHTIYFIACWSNLSTTPTLPPPPHVFMLTAAQYLQPASTANGPATQPAKHPYEEALAQLPQSVLDQPPNPPPPNVQPIVDKMAEYAANNGEEFEKTVLEKNRDDVRFSFLRPGNEYHAYYTTKKLLYITKLREASEKQREAEKAAVHSLKPDGSVGFALGGSKLQASSVVLEDSSSGEEEEGEGLFDGVELASEKEKRKKKPPTKNAENDAVVAVDSEFRYHVILSLACFSLYCVCSCHTSLRSIHMCKNRPFSMPACMMPHACIGFKFPGTKLHSSGVIRKRLYVKLLISLKCHVT